MGRLARWHWIGVCLLGGLVAGPVRAQWGEEDGCTVTADSDEPRIRFLDDLFGPPCARGRRDPFEERMETDRHDFTQSTRTVGRGAMQIESGYTYFYKDEREVIEQSHTTPEFLLRLGLTDDIEFRLRTNYAWRFSDEEENRTGPEDLRLGLKLRVTDQEGLIPESALELLMSLPTGGEPWTTGRVEPGCDLIYGWELCESVELYGSSGFFTNALGDFGLLPDEPESDHFLVWTQSLALGADLTENTTCYFECFNLFSHGADPEFTISILNIGLDYFVTHNLVFDFRIGWGLTGDADDLFTGIGGGYRF